VLGRSIYDDLSSKLMPELPEIVISIEALEKHIPGLALEGVRIAMSVRVSAKKKLEAQPAKCPGRSRDKMTLI